MKSVICNTQNEREREREMECQSLLMFSFCFVSTTWDVKAAAHVQPCIGLRASKQAPVPLTTFGPPPVHFIATRQINDTLLFHLQTILSKNCPAILPQEGIPRLNPWKSAGAHPKLSTAMPLPTLANNPLGFIFTNFRSIFAITSHRPASPPSPSLARKHYAVAWRPSLVPLSYIQKVH